MAANKHFRDEPVAQLDQRERFLTSRSRVRKQYFAKSMGLLRLSKMSHLSVFTQFFAKNCTKVPAGSLKFLRAAWMGKKLLAVASLIIGLAVFIVVLNFAGFGNIIEPFRKFSLFYLALFLLTTSLLHVITTLRWSTVLRYERLKVPFLPLLKLKLIGAAVSYLTPAARVGGEPVRGYLLKKRLGIEGKRAYSSVLIETSLGLGIDALFSSLLLVSMLLFFTLPKQLEGFALAISMLALASTVIFYLVLISRLGPFSLLFRISSRLIKSGLLKKLVVKIMLIEESMVEFFHFRKRGVAAAVLVTSISWPLTYFQYKFALLSIGFDASFTIIILSIIATSLSGIIPIPAAFGVQEAGHFSIFSMIASPSVGIALSLLIRLKDLIMTFVGLVFLSHEGLNLFEVLRNKGNKA